MTKCLTQATYEIKIIIWAHGFEGLHSEISQAQLAGYLLGWVPAGLGTCWAGYLLDWVPDGLGTWRMAVVKCGVNQKVKAGGWSKSTFTAKTLSRTFWALTPNDHSTSH